MDRSDRTAPSTDGVAASGEPASRSVSRNPETGGDYNRLPYPSMPVTHTQPARLAALATLFGLRAPSVERARVLELGCASGGNIVPLAARFPNAHFTGIDLASRHIADGRKFIAALALANIELRQGDLAGMTLDGARFDYVICHGVFSWVPKPVQDAIFEICQKVLAPDGVAAISYNVLPGWHLRMVVRDLCLHYAGAEGSPQRRVAAARAALEQIAQSARAGEPYGLLLRTEASRLRQMPAAYILGEFLAPHNAPCYVRDFIAQAERNGLDYLCDADLSASVPQAFDPATPGRLPPLAGADPMSAEQHIDFLTGRPFRCSVLVRRQPAAQRPFVPNATRLRPLHLASPVRFDPAQDSGATGNTEQPAAFGDDRARLIATGDPVVRQALARLATAYPATVTVNELIAGTAHDVPGRAESEAGLCDALFAMVMAGQATAAAVPLRVGRATDARPCAWRVARMEAASGQPWITSLVHSCVPMRPILMTLLPYCDGAHDHAALRMRLAAALESGVVQVAELPADQPAPSHERLALVAGSYLERMLHYLSRHALLEPEVLQDLTAAGA